MRNGNQVHGFVTEKMQMLYQNMNCNFKCMEDFINNFKLYNKN